MKFYSTLIIICFSLGVVSANAQYTAGITGKPDTSYNMQSAYRNTIKSNPEAKMVADGPNEAVTEKHAVVYCNYGDRKMLVDVFNPKAAATGKRTAIIIIHGGGWRSGNRMQHYPLARKLASVGYVCFTPEYRLSTEALFPAGVYDVKAAIRWVRKHAASYGIDTGRIVVAGFSAGGELAAFMGVTGNMPLFEGTENKGISAAANAVIDIDGTLSFVHPESGEGDDKKGISAATYWFGYPKKENKGLWEAASPLSYAGPLTPPFLFLNSSVDRMHAGRNDFIKILSDYNIYTEVHSFDNSPHGFCLFEPWFTPTVNYIDAFLKKTFNAAL